MGMYAINEIWLGQKTPIVYNCVFSLSLFFIDVVNRRISALPFHDSRKGAIIKNT